MIERLHQLLHDIANRRRAQRFQGGLLALLAIVVATGWILHFRAIPLATIFLVLGCLTVISLAGVAIWSRRGLGDPRAVARDIERTHPELKTALLAALDQRADAETGELSYLQGRVILDALISSQRDHWRDEIPLQRLRALRISNVFLAAFVLTSAFILLLSNRQSLAGTLPGNSSDEAIEALGDFSITVEPGDVEIERNTPLAIRARFGDGVPENARLELTTPTGSSRIIPMDRPFTDPVFQTRLAAVGESGSYRVLFGGQASKRYQVSVFDFPELVRSEATLDFPDHLNQPNETIADPRTVRAMEGTGLEFLVVSNLPDLQVTLESKDRDAIPLARDADKPDEHRTNLVLLEDRRLEIVLTDSKGRTNKRREVLDIRVTRNRAPVVKVILPRPDEKVTPIQELELEAEVSDDSELVAHGLEFSVAGGEWQSVAGENEAGQKSASITHLIDLEAAGAKPRDVVMWNAWGEDIGPDGQRRRVSGDVHIVQVREFDEEFYQRTAPQGEQAQQDQQQQGQGPAQQAADLVEMQKQILDATWNLRREHAEINRSAPPEEDVQVLLESQELAITTASELEQNLPDPSLRQYVMDARLEMADAVTSLAEARDKKSAEPLDQAIFHEQEALRFLYQLTSSETMIEMSQSSSSSSSSSSQSQQAMEGLDLEMEENPYQTESQARPETPQGEVAEAMETLNRLEQLARQQRDLNEEMQELQMALNEAETPEERAEIERRLKQLRDEQRELLGEVDELREESSEQTSEEQQKALEEIREQAQRANEDLADGQLGEALANGRRAEESLEELEDEFRESSAAALGESLRELRREARELEERQEELARGRDEPQEAAPGLGGTEEEEAFEEQRAQLENLMNDMRETAEMAEEAEPLVARDLTEALRDASQAGLTEALEEMERTGDAQSAERAGEGIAGLTREIEEAAERILGNEAQGLRYARDELERLAEEAGRGLAQSDDETEEGELGGERSDEGQPGAEPGGQPGPGTGQEQAENDQPGEGEDGQQAGRGNQPGEGEEERQAGGGGQPGEAEGEEEGERGMAGANPGEQPGEGGQGDQGGERPEGTGRGGRREGSHNDGRGIAGTDSPFTGGNYEDWTDRLNDLEDLIDDAETQEEVARAREAGRAMRREFRRHSVVPDGEAIESQILEPLTRAARELDEKLRELQKEDPLAPVGTDPVPEEYDEVVRRYFEELGQ